MLALRIKRRRSKQEGGAEGYELLPAIPTTSQAASAQPSGPQPLQGCNQLQPGRPNSHEPREAVQQVRGVTFMLARACNGHVAGSGAARTPADASCGRASVW
jgi:hypothetical protein